MAYILKEGQTFNYNGVVDLPDAQKKICSQQLFIQVDEDGIKTFSGLVMIGTYASGDWSKKLEETGVPVQDIPYNDGTVNIADLYTAVSNSGMLDMDVWVSDV